MSSGSGNGNTGTNGSKPNPGASISKDQNGSDTAVERAKDILSRRVKDLEGLNQALDAADGAVTVEEARRLRLIKEALEKLEHISEKLKGHGRLGLLIGTALSIGLSAAGTNDAKAAELQNSETLEKIRTLYGSAVATQLENYAKAYDQSKEQPDDLPEWAAGILNLLDITNPLHFDTVAPGTLPPGYPLAWAALKKNIDLSPVNEELGKIQQEMQESQRNAGEAASGMAEKKAQLEKARAELSQLDDETKGLYKIAYGRDIDASINKLDSAIGQYAVALNDMSSVNQLAGEISATEDQDPSAQLQAFADALAQGIAANINRQIQQKYAPKAFAAYDGQNAQHGDPTAPPPVRVAATKSQGPTIRAA